MSDDLKRVSGLWLRESKGGSKYMAGKTDEAIPPGSKLLIFKNERKETENQPDYQLMIADPGPQPDASGGQHKAPDADEIPF